MNECPVCGNTGPHVERPDRTVCGDAFCGATVPVEVHAPEPEPLASQRRWVPGDPEPADHPVVYNDDDAGRWHFRWEAPGVDAKDSSGGWWCVERPGDLWSWEELFRDNNWLREAPPLSEQPWCALVSRCACFGTTAPSTGMRAGGTLSRQHRVRCAHFRPDGGTTPTLRGMK